MIAALPYIVFGIIILLFTASVLLGYMDDDEK